MVVYVNVKDGKVDISKAELERLLLEEYRRGYNEGNNNQDQLTLYNNCPYGYAFCPYKTNTPYVTWSNTESDLKITCNPNQGDKK